MTELTWDGKYSKDGKKSAPVRIALPYQTIETVNESAQDRLRTLDLFAQDNLGSGAGQIVNQFRGK